MVEKIDFIPDYDQDLRETNWKSHPVIEVELV
jgi:hypothetical protein